MRGTWGPNRQRGLGGLLAVVIAIGAGATTQADDEATGDVVLAGTVVDEAGKPVAGAEVRALGPLGSAPVKSGADGSFRLTPRSTPMGGIFARLLADAGDGRLGYLPVNQDAEHVGPVRVVVKPSRAIEVRVVDPGGRAIEGAGVHLLSNLVQLIEGRTDADGRWKANAPADADDWALYALRSKVGFDYATAARARGSLEPPRPLPERLTLTLDGARPPLRVKAVDESGKPLADVLVGPWLIMKPGRETNLNGMSDVMLETDAGGVATFGWLPLRMEGQLAILARSPGRYVPNHYAAVPADKPTDEVVVTLNSYQRLSGRVTTADGRPALGAAVQVAGRGSKPNGFRGLVRTGPDGRYALDVEGEQAYIVTVTKGDLAAPYKWDVIVRSGKPVEGVDLVLGPATHVKGRVTVGDDRKPAAKIYVIAEINKGSIPAELQQEGDRLGFGMTMSVVQQTDDEGRYDFQLGPGEYSIRGPARIEPVELTIPTENPPLEIVHDFSMPRPETGPFTATVVDAKGQPVAGAVLNGRYTTRSRAIRLPSSKSDTRGIVRVERSLDPLLIHAETPDRSLAGIARVDAEATEARIVVEPTATGSGRLVDAECAPIAGRELIYEIRARVSSARDDEFAYLPVGKVETDEGGRFTLGGLVVGARYNVSVTDEKDRNYSFNSRDRIVPTAPGPFDVGDLAIDLEPRKPYVFPTPAQRAGDSFAAHEVKSPREQLDDLLVEANREYTCPLLLFGGPSDPACIDLFRLFQERSPRDENDESRPTTPGNLRFEFELASFDATRPDVRAFAKELGTPIGDGDPPRLVVLSNKGGFVAAHPLVLGGDGKLDAPALGAFLLAHKPPTRDAEAMLAEALAKAKPEDKRVLLVFGGSWCGPCRRLGRFLDANHAELDRHYVCVKLDVARDAHASQLEEKYQGVESGGAPWYVILDAAGKPLITSNAPELRDEYASNIGFPTSKIGINHLMNMFKQTAPGLSDDALAALRRSLEKRP